MLQRIQTIYLLLTIVCLSIVSFGFTFFTGIIENGKIVLTSNSLDTIMDNHGEDKSLSLPIYLMFIAIIVLSGITIFSFKSLKRQIKIARLTSILYVISIAIIIVNYFIMSKQAKSVEIGVGFYILAAGLLFSNLAIVGIRKDQKLIDSVNRLR
jgi:hypothetical protein